MMRFLRNRYGQPGGIGNVIGDAGLAEDFLEDPVATALGGAQRDAWARGDIRTFAGATALRAIIPNGQAPAGDPVPRDWLVPAPLGFYVSPNEPVDPRDCDRWPTSPFCGGTGLSPTRLGFDVDFTFNACEVCWVVNPRLAFVSLSPYFVCFRLPSCRETLQTQPVEPVRPESPFILPPIPNALTIPGHCRLVLGRYYYAYEDSAPRPSIRIYNSGPGFNGAGRLPNPSWSTETTASYDWIEAAITHVVGFYGVQELGIGWISTQISREQAIQIVGTSVAGRPIKRRYWNQHGGIRVINYSMWRDFPHGFVVPGTSIPIQQAAFGLIDDSIQNSPSAWGLNAQGWGLILNSCAVVDLPQPEERLPMPCNCDELEEMVRGIYNRLGVEDYPVELPAKLFDDSEREFTVESNAQYLTWLVEQIDGLTGQFPIELEIEDIDPIQQGNQKQQITLPNLAESLADIYALSLKNNVDSHVQIEFLTRLTAEILSTKIATLITQDYTRANADFLGYEGNPVNREVDSNFNPDPEAMDNFNKLFRQSRKRFKGWKNDSRETVLDYLQKNQFINGILKEVFFRGNDRIAEVQAEIDESLKDQGDRDSNWDSFIQETEDGASLRNSNQPRPRITDLNNLDDVFGDIQPGG
ncbi:MAG: hypothetical protein AAF215_27935 [Cyanobacteria bacterium P01_A01_bin.123]